VLEAPHPVGPLPSDVRCEQRPEPVPPEPYRLVAHVDAPLEKQVSTLRSDSGNRTYNITTRRITSGEELKR
jgi:hypothetical protein